MTGLPSGDGSSVVPAGLVAAVSGEAAVQSGRFLARHSPHRKATPLRPQAAERLIPPHDPAAELGERWPDWKVETASLGVGWVAFDPWAQTILLSRSEMRKDPDRVLAQALALLDLGKVSTDRRGFTRQDEQAAAWLAEVRLGRNSAELGNMG